MSDPLPNDPQDQAAAQQPEGQPAGDPNAQPVSGAHGADPLGGAHGADPLAGVDASAQAPAPAPGSPEEAAAKQKADEEAKKKADEERRKKAKDRAKRLLKGLGTVVAGGAAAAGVAIGLAASGPKAQKHDAPADPNASKGGAGSGGGDGGAGGAGGAEAEAGKALTAKEKAAELTEKLSSLHERASEHLDAAADLQDQAGEASEHINNLLGKGGAGGGGDSGGAGGQAPAVPQAPAMPAAPAMPGTGAIGAASGVAGTVGQFAAQPQMFGASSGGSSTVVVVQGAAASVPTTPSIPSTPSLPSTPTGTTGSAPTTSVSDAPPSTTTPTAPTTATPTGTSAPAPDYSADQARIAQAQANADTAQADATATANTAQQAQANATQAQADAAQAAAQSQQANAALAQAQAQAAAEADFENRVAAGGPFSPAEAAQAALEQQNPALAQAEKDAAAADLKAAQAEADAAQARATAAQARSDAQTAAAQAAQADAAASAAEAKAAQAEVDAEKAELVAKQDNDLYGPNDARTIAAEQDAAQKRALANQLEAQAQQARAAANAADAKAAQALAVEKQDEAIAEQKEAAAVQARQAADAADAKRDQLEAAAKAQNATPAQLAASAADARAQANAADTAAVAARADANAADQAAADARAKAIAADADARAAEAAAAQADAAAAANPNDPALAAKAKELDAIAAEKRAAANQADANAAYLEGVAKNKDAIAGQKEAAAAQKDAAAAQAESAAKAAAKAQATPAAIAPLVAAVAAADKPIALNAAQTNAVIAAIQAATGLPIAQILGVLQDATIKGKLDPVQLLGALQSLVKPLNTAKLLDELTKAAAKLGSPLGDKITKLVAELKDILGLEKKIAAKLGLQAGASEADIQKALRDLAKRMKDQIKDKSKPGSDQKRGKAVCKVHKDGKPLALDASKIVSCVVNQHVDLVDSFALTLTDNDLKLSSDKTFAEGEKLGIELGWEDGKVGFVIQGEITGRELDFPRRGPVLLTVHGLSFDHHLNRGRYTRQFCQDPGKLETKDSDIAKKIADECKLTAGIIDETPMKFEYIFQNNLTNLEFLRQRAQLYNYEVGLELDPKDNEPKFFYRKLPIAKQPQLKLKRGRDLKSFRARMNIACQVPKVLVRGWDWKNASPTEITATADKADLLDDMGMQKVGPQVISDFVGKAQMKPKPDGIVEVVTSKPVISTEHAKTIAKSVLNYYAYGFVTGDGSTFGNPTIRAGSTIELDAIGNRFEGKYYVQSASHVFEGRGYTTMFNLYRPGITPEGKGENVPNTPPPPPPKPQPDKTFFEFLAEGLKSIPLAQAPARLEQVGVDKDFKDNDLDAQAEIKKPNIDPGKYSVQIKEIVGGTWGSDDPNDSQAMQDAEKKAEEEAKKHQVDNLKFGYQA